MIFGKGKNVSKATEFRNTGLCTLGDSENKATEFQNHHINSHLSRVSYSLSVLYYFFYAPS